MKRDYQNKLLFMCVCAATCSMYLLAMLPSVGTRNDANGDHRTDILDLSDTIQQAYLANQSGSTSIASTVNDSRDPYRFERYEPDTGSHVPVPIVITTYMRSGSSFLGEILQANPDTFYWFEPVHEMWGLHKANINHQYDFKDGTKRIFPSFLDIAVPTIKNLSTCDLDNVPMNVLREQFLEKSKQMREFVQCRGYKKKGHASNTRLIQCLPNLKTKCANSKYIVVKTIRINMKSLEIMLENIPTLKVIHLMRDPRGTSRSQQAVGQLSKQNYRQEIADFCKLVYEDVLQKELLEKKYPDRIRTVFYEDVARNPITYAKSLYAYLGMQFTANIEKTIHGFTLAGRSGSKTCGILCTQMANSTEEASNWRNQISMTLVKIVDTACFDLYNKIGYKSIPNVTLLRDRSFELRY
ncbi:carbohydrate sulfotransferase 5-like isoform X2 [Mizuhopecten yessoensis]|uniref:carbohydrate sulfotransferase 5-like isoform X2 n=1 Tax=Mizuhopecten yessoensis TaxID=6573 RepID=UPI000B45F431|nr:carbohydrate sulfotransferase 5-like isoform X2 [Mizuhopecten yessoensis]